MLHAAGSEFGDHFVEVVLVWFWDSGAFVASDCPAFDRHYAGLVDQYGDPAGYVRRVR